MYDEWQPYAIPNAPLLGSDWFPTELQRGGGHPMTSIKREDMGLEEREKVGNGRENQRLQHGDAKWVEHLVAEGERRSWDCEYTFVS